MQETPATRVTGRSRGRIGDCLVAARWPRRGGLAPALSVRRAGVTLGLAGCVLGGAAAPLSGLSPAAAAAGPRDGWSIVAGPNGSRVDNTLVGVSAGSATSAWAVGYDGGAGAFRTLTERWNGSAWAVVPSPSPSQLDNVLTGVATASPTSAWAVGYAVRGYHRALIEHWDGSAWRVVPSPRAGRLDSDLWGVTALSPANAWAVGNENIGGFRFRPLIEHWNGAAWTLVPAPSPPLRGVGASLFSVAATSPRDIWAVGNYDTGTRFHRFQPLIEHWNGARWSIVPAPVPGSAQLSQISLQAPDDGWAVGIRGAVPSTQALIEHWDGHRWTEVSSPVIKGSSLAGVLALTPHLAWAVGNCPLPHGGFRTLIERWNGRAWTVTSSPNRDRSSELLGIAGTQQHIWSVGDSLASRGTPLTSTLILRH